MPGYTIAWDFDRKRNSTQLLLASRRVVITPLDDLDLLAAPGRFPFILTDRLAVVVLQPVPDMVIVGYFFDGQLVRMTEEAAGEA